MLFYLTLVPSLIDMTGVTATGWLELVLDARCHVGDRRSVLDAPGGEGEDFPPEQPHDPSHQPNQQRHDGLGGGGDSGRLTGGLRENGPASSMPLAAQPIFTSRHAYGDG